MDERELARLNKREAGAAFHNLSWHMNTCCTCGCEVDRKARPGLKLFCGQRCFGISRRKEKTKAQKVAEKRLYDMQYRAKNRASLRAKKADYFQRSYDPERARAVRAKNMPRHVEYCRQPRYKAYKQKYDTAYRAKKYFGPFWESALLVNDLDREIGERATKEELALAKGTVNKAQTRRREYENLINSSQP